MLLAILLGCSSDSSKDTVTLGSCSADEGGETITTVVNTLTYARQVDGIANGFNLDGVISDNEDETGCFKPDLVSPDGTLGVDNAFSALIPALESTEAVALETLIQNSINNGELLLMLEISGIDDWQNDDCVSVGIYRATGVPLVGTDGLLLDGQSFKRDWDLPWSQVEQVSIVDGVLNAVPMDIELPVQVLDEFLELEMHDGGVHMTINEDHTMDGFFGGAVPINIFTDIVTLPDVNIPDAIVSLIAAAADVFPDENGVCQDMSVAFEITALPGFFYPEE